MDIDMAVLRAMEREKDIPVESVALTIEAALLQAYTEPREPTGWPAWCSTARTGTSPCGLAKSSSRRRTAGGTAPADEPRHRGGRTRRGAGRCCFGGRWVPPRDTRWRARRPFWGRSSTTLPPTSAGSRRPRPSRRSCSGSGTPRTSACSATSWTRKGNWCRASCSRAATRGWCRCKLGQIEGVLPPTEQVPRKPTATEPGCASTWVSVRRGLRGPQITLSRTHPNLVKKLFEDEVPEIADGTVLIKGIAREAGHGSKVAVISTDPAVFGEGSMHRCDGCARPQHHDRDARGEARHHRLVGRARRLRRATHCRPPR